MQVFSTLIFNLLTSSMIWGGGGGGGMAQW